MKLNCIKSFTVELDGPTEAAFMGGEVVSGVVVLELRKDTRVNSMKVQGRGVAMVHWLEDRGMNSVYNDYTSKITYFRKGQHLVRGQCGIYPLCSVLIRLGFCRNAVVLCFLLLSTCEIFHFCSLALITACCRWINGLSSG